MRYFETDQMGVVHHANYIVWCELARTRLCLEAGFHYAEIEKRGLLLLVTGVTLAYRAPARYGDTVRAACWVERVGMWLLDMLLVVPSFLLIALIVGAVCAGVAGAAMAQPAVQAGQGACPSCT